ncbi:MAG: GTPase ObgE [Puniceicoccaceae bacterium]
MFFDDVKVTLRAGNGGDGGMSFRREKYIPKGGPDGGDGGRGGDVVLVCDENVADLRAFHFKKNWKARHGGGGMGRQRHGKNGASVELRLPEGTEVIDLESGKTVKELLENGETFVICKGGKGGLGNVHFKTATNQSPRKFTEGAPGEEGAYRLVMKVIADVGLVGFPNAGKSTLLSRLTKAKPEIGAYAFTTLTPSVGYTEYDDRYRRLRMADVPGLIDGAAENRGLGHRFLRHIERCPVQLYLIDLSEGDGRDAVEDFKVLREEVRAYKAELAERPYLIAGNKMDEPGAEEVARRLEVATGEKVYRISAGYGEGLEPLVSDLHDTLKRLREVSLPSADE